LYGMIHSPGDEPSAITVGAANTFGSNLRNDDGVTTYSSRGPTRGTWTDDAGVRHHDNLVKPDLVAPGNKIIDAAAEDNYLITTYPSLDAGVSEDDKRRMMYLNGTSMATRVVAGDSPQVRLRHGEQPDHLLPENLRPRRDGHRRGDGDGRRDGHGPDDALGRRDGHGRRAL